MSRIDGHVRGALALFIPLLLAAAGWGGPRAVVGSEAGQTGDRDLRCDTLSRLLGGTGATSGEVCRVSFPRGDLGVRLLGARLPAGMGLTSWAAFAPAGDRGAVVMGDLALTSEELPAVLAGLREGGIRVTAVHRHMLGEEPAMSFAHYLGVGEATELARALRTALERAPAAVAGGTGPAAAAAGGGAGAEAATRAGVVAGVRCEEIAGILGADPASASTGPGYCKVSRPRDDLRVTVDGIPVPSTMGIGSWFAFRETAAGGEAVIAGDMALTQEQVNPAVAALRERGIEVVSLHNHMLFEEPRVVFFHFQARGAALELARGLRAGLDSAGLTDAGPESVSATEGGPSPAPQAADSAAVAELVHSFHEALASGDSATAMSLLTEDVRVLESGGLETRSEYAGHHLPADMAFAAAVSRERGELQVTVEGDVAWSVATSTVEGEFRGRPVSARGAELMVLRRTSEGWRIAAIHWSSRPLREP